MHEPAAPAPPPGGWETHELARFLSERRDWAAVTSFYERLVAGDTELSDLGLLQLLEPPPPLLPVAPAASPPAEPVKSGRQRARTTWRVHVSYLGPAFRQVRDGE